MTAHRNQHIAESAGGDRSRNRDLRDRTRSCSGVAVASVQDTDDSSRHGERRRHRRGDSDHNRTRRAASVRVTSDAVNADRKERVAAHGGGTVGRGRARSHLAGASGGGAGGGGSGAPTRQEAVARSTIGTNVFHESQGRRQDHAELETRWQAYLQGEEFVTFHAVVESLLSLPSVEQLSERRADFELLLHLLNRLGQTLEVEHVSKHYRAHYSPDVQLSGYLYSTLLTAFTLLPSYVLNGQEFYVSDTVLDQCKSLQYVFEETCKELKRQFENLQPFSLEHIRNDIKRSLVYFDKSWCRFEMPALEEIEAIHKQACRPLIEAIEVEKVLCEWEHRSSSASRGCPAGTHKVRVEVQRTRLMEKICELNRLANIDGKGRSDMDLACVVEAERLVSKPLCLSLRGLDQGYVPGQRHSVGASPVLVLIARSLLRSLSRLRRVFQKYSRCLYQLNSHLANNNDLVRGLERFETAWETASSYLVQPGPRRLALLAFDIVSGFREPAFEAALTSLDPGFLVATLPRAFILHEMRRFLSARNDAFSNGLSVTYPVVKNSAKAEGDGMMLPRPLEGGKQKMPSQLTSAYQFTALARTFLPPEMIAEYDGAAAALGRLSETRVLRVRSMLLLNSTPVGSKTATPLVSSAQYLPKPQATPAAAELPPRTPCPPRMAVPNSSSGRPTSSAPTTFTGSAPSATPSAAAIAAAAIVACGSSSSEGVRADEIQEESDDEEEIPTIDLSGLRGAEATEGAEMAAAAATAAANAALGTASCPGTSGGLRAQGGSIVRSGSLGVESEPPLVKNADGGSRENAGIVGGGTNVATPVAISTARISTGDSDSQEADVCKVVSTVSTLALHLQRAKPHEWNELIQIVIQGYMLAKSSEKDDSTGADAQGQQSVTQSKRQQSQPKHRHHHHQQVAAEVW
eukprot:TRINITY_DN68000_c0_g1_i1.p1 TRINITY_DN68000_c0_g1~~TRINITY_DN68000_c0_g1_i1.p1  ORF type:complete len:917 (+),score=173.67 TRINITY_DN68000_c0_g1_i1:329-3079(+)